MPSSFREFRRAGLFTACLLLINLVGDGGPQKTAGLAHQLVLLPITALFLFFLAKLLVSSDPGASSRWTPHRALYLVVLFELAAAALFLYQAHHFAGIGYRLHPVATAVFFAASLAALLALAARRAPHPPQIFAATLTVYIGGMLLAIAGFPLTYLRSDMLPVIQWAGLKLLHHINPYTPIHIADRLYDFPYLPGMIVAYLPFLAAHLDLRFATILFNTISATLLYRAAAKHHRIEVASLLALFLLCPFLQYRHELYNTPHWLTIVATFLLLHRGRFLWAAFVCGIGCAIYQFSWIILPFILLNAYRRRGWLEAARLTFAAAAGALLLVEPFLRSAAHRIAGNTVTQWGLAAHTDAQPMNLSYWITFLIHPAQLLKLQASLMLAIFAVAVIKRRCSTLEDTLRFAILALTLFILCNVLVDGYFYLMLLVLMLVYVCIINGWWSRPPTSVPSSSG